MKTRFLKREINRLRNTILHKNIELDRKEKEIQELKSRFRELGSVTETAEGSGPVVCIKKEIKPIPYGAYRVLLEMNGTYEDVKRDMVYMIAEGLIEEDIAQFIYRENNGSGPLGMPTLAIKLYVVPWEKMAKPTKIHLEY